MYTNLGRNVEKFTGINGRMEGRKEGVPCSTHNYIVITRAKNDVMSAQDLGKIK